MSAGCAIVNPRVASLSASLTRRVVESHEEVERMATISSRALTILKDAAGVHEFTDVEQAHIEVLAEQLNEILKASKQREKQQAERH